MLLRLCYLAAVAQAVDPRPSYTSPNKHHYNRSDVVAESATCLGGRCVDFLRLAAGRHCLCGALRGTNMQRAPGDGGDRCDPAHVMRACPPDGLFAYKRGDAAAAAPTLPHDPDLPSRASHPDAAACAAAWHARKRFTGNKPPVGSSSDEDLTVYANFFENRRGGVYVEMGAFDGVSESNTLFFARCLGWTGVLAEASPPSFRHLVNGGARPESERVLLAPSCASDAGEAIDMLAVPFTSASVVSDVNVGEAGRPVARVHCGPLTPYLADLGVTHVDFFSLDVEGAEFRVLSTLDLDRIRVDVIIAESLNRDCGKICPHREAVRGLLRARNYTLIEGAIPRSDLFVHPSIPVPRAVVRPERPVGSSAAPQGGNRSTSYLQDRPIDRGHGQ